MIGTIDIKINAAHPQLPLSPFFAFVGSPSQVRVVNAPKQIGDWKLTKVYVTANYPDNQSASVECVLTGGCWHGTLGSSSLAGQSANGFAVTADGVKEDGTTAVTGYVIGRGDLTILNADSTITVGETTYYAHLVNAQPANPKRGDLCVIDGVWKIYTGTEWSALGSSVSVSWNDITGKPSTFPPSAHTHTKSEITDFPTAMTPTAHKASHSTGGTDALTPSDIGAEPSGTAADAVSVHNLSNSAHSDIRTAVGGKQTKITASGILKCDGEGGVTAAVAGTDYIAQHQDISGKLDKSGGTMTGNLTMSGASIAISNSGVTKMSLMDAGSSGAMIEIRDREGANPLQIDNHAIYKGNYTLTIPETKSGTLALTNDIPSVVAPSTSSSDAGKAADAKATGDSLAAKVSSFLAVGGVTPTVTNGVADLSSLFSSSNTSFAGTVMPIEAGGTTSIKSYIDTTVGNIESALAEV